MTPKFRYFQTTLGYIALADGRDIGLVRKLRLNRWEFLAPKSNWFGWDHTGNVLQTRYAAAEALWRRVGGEE